MPDYKRQHYVPRCHLRPFSLNGVGAAINLFNIPRTRSVPNAPVKGQCARDYFYGDDLELERGLQLFENGYGRVVRVLQDDQRQPTNDDLDLLRGFAFLQYQRTLMAMQRMRMMHEGVHNAIYQGRPITPPDLDVSDRAMMLWAMRMYAGLQEAVTDLKSCIIKNETQIDFVTSDDPAIVTSKFYVQRQGSNNFGVGSSGVLIFLPLTPQFLLMCYDGDVYVIPGMRGCFVPITSRADAIALNELQYLKAAENVYFSRWADREQVEHEFRRVSAQRPETWCKISVFVPDGVVEGRERFRRATDDERRTAPHTMLAVSNFHPAPSGWISGLKYRDPVRTYYNGSAAGHVRKAVWDNRFYRKDQSAFE